MDLDDGTFEAVPGSDFVITRVAYRDNSSKYYINDRSSNFTEVTKNLKGKGVDLDNNRFLILQGEVEQISLMKPKAQGSQDEGFLEYLEDIIGTSKYAQKIDESYQELESLNEKRSGVVQMVKLAEKERDGLEDGKNEAETYMLKELSLLKWQQQATKLAHEDTSAKMLDLQENITSLEENLNNDREKIQIETGQQTIKELRKAIQDSKKKYERHNKENETLCANFKEKEEKASLVQENYEETQKMIDEHKAVLDKAKSEYCNMKKTVYELRAWKDKAEFELEAMKKKSKDLKFEWKAYKDKLDKLQTALIKHMDQIQKDLVESEKVQATLADEHLNSCCDLQRAIETAALLEAQMKEMNPNLDSISEYQRKVSLYNEKVEDLSIITKQRDDIKRQYDELRKKRHVTFLFIFYGCMLCNI
ncbi:structural maintenance of chromosomes protein 4 isoform X2 [Rosa chinensis]|nr:structural maintenance of chromosomes protein 4 isoform X2 [Rosa chinensis]